MRFATRDHTGARLDTFEIRKTGNAQNATQAAWLVGVALAGIAGRYLVRQRVR